MFGLGDCCFDGIDVVVVQWFDYVLVVGMKVCWGVVVELVLYWVVDVDVVVVVQCYQFVQLLYFGQ